MSNAVDIQELLETTLKEIKGNIDSLAFWQQEQILKRVQEAITVAYKEGRSAEAYRQRGPRVINPYE